MLFLELFQFDVHLDSIQSPSGSVTIRCVRSSNVSALIASEQNILW